MMQALRFSEMSDLTRATRRNIAEGYIILEKTKYKLVYRHQNVEQIQDIKIENKLLEEGRLLGWYAVWLL
jgi:hypothetical protein